MIPKKKGRHVAKHDPVFKEGAYERFVQNLANCQEVTLVHRPSPQHRDDVK